MVAAGLLQRERAARLVDFHRRDPSLPSFEEVLGAMANASFGAGARTGARGDAVAGAAGAVGDHRAALAQRRPELRRGVQVGGRARLRTPPCPTPPLPVARGAR